MSVRSRRSSRNRNRLFQRKALALAIGGAIALAFTGGAFAQAVNGTIHGSVPVAPNETIMVTSTTGLSRTVTVGPSGMYSITLPVGTYTVMLLQDGKPVQTRTGVTATGFAGATVDFVSTSSTPVQTLSTVNVSAMSIPPIDVTSTNQVTTITAKQLQQLPLGRNAESIAMLAPGVIQGGALLQMDNPSPLGTPLLSFGGSSAAENAYYVDGFNTTDALTGQGGFMLPYFAIEQQQTFTSGYGAQYGRTIGGVMSQIGQSGSNEWHFGFRAIYQPASLQNGEVNQFFNNPATPAQFGQLRTYRNDDRGTFNTAASGQEVTGGTNRTFDAYVSGPIIPDKLFFFLGVEQSRTYSTTTGPTSNALRTFATAHQPKIYAKINWNINANNNFTLTAMQLQNKIWSSQYNFDYNTLQDTTFSDLNPTTKNSVRMFVANYTSFIGNDLTFHAMFGKMHNEFFTLQPSFPGFSPDIPHIISASKQDPAFLPPEFPNGIINKQSVQTIGPPAHKSTDMDYRLSLDWKVPWNLLGTHDVSVGIDNIQTWDKEDGSFTTGPINGTGLGYSWLYGTADPTKPLVGTVPGIAPYAGPPNSNPGTSGDAGYYASQFVFANLASVRVLQQAEYINDKWQITPDFLATIGIRNDTFVNYNPIGLPFSRNTKPNWEPRLGFSWNVLGNSTLKVYGNAGRYYITMPAGVALREAGASIFTNVYGTYTGINSLGEPTGFVTVPMNNGGHGPVNTVGVSANNEYGETLNPLMVAALNAKPEYSDNFVLGAQWQFVPNYVAGIQMNYFKLGRILDDWDDQNRMCAAGLSEGLSYLTPANCTTYTLGSVLINPGETMNIMVNSPTGQLHQITVTSAQQGWQQGPKRNYYSLDLSMEHPWNGKWFAKADVLYSRAYGNTGGPVDATIGQGGDSVVITEQWDFEQIMQWSNGLLPQNRKWQIKLYGAYAINPEWTVGANLFISSGMPNICLGYLGPQQTDPFGYATGNGSNGAYHWCGGEPAVPGASKFGFTPWTHQLDVNVNYNPAWQDHRFNFNFAVFNLLNEQKPLQNYYGFGTTASPEPRYGMPIVWEAPRSVRLMVSYDFAQAPKATQEPVAPPPPPPPPAAPPPPAPPQNVVIDLRGVNFKFDRPKPGEHNIGPTLKPPPSASLAILGQAVDTLNRYPQVQIQIDGYTDSIGKPAYNQKLSERRANIVDQYLTSHGIDPSRITDVRGFGENDPVDTNKTAAGRQRNRRVEFKVEGQGFTNGADQPGQPQQ